MTGSLLDNALAVSTGKSYQRTIDTFDKFCRSELNLSKLFPADTRAVVSFVAFLFKAGYAHSSIVTALSAISYSHKIRSFVDPTAAFVVNKLLQGASYLRPSVDPRAPITKPVLHSLVKSTPNVTECYYHNAMLSSTYLLAFHAFLRIGEIVVSSLDKAHSVLQLDQVTVSSKECVAIFHSYKHYQGPPVSLVISNIKGSLFCPVQHMKSYLLLRGASSGPLYCFPNGSPISRSFFNQHLHKSLIWAGLSTSLYKGHSFRIGAATTAAIMGVSGDDIQRMGRWKSQAFRKYIRIPILQLQ